MAHINYVRQVERRLFQSLGEIMPLNMAGCNFAAFGGTAEQRAAAAVQAASRYCGVCGIVVLVKDAKGPAADPLEAAILGMPGALPEARAQYRRTPAYTIPWRDYDLMYGLDEGSVEALLLSGLNVPGQASLMNPVIAGLQAYLQIMEHQFREDPTDFGAYPFNLDLLRELAVMPYETLHRRVLRHLPEEIYDQVQPVLSKPDVQTGAAAVVRQFAYRFQKYGRRDGSFLNHSRRSIISAVSRREVVCVKVPDSSGVLLDYIEAELEQLSAAGIQYLLIASGLDLSRSPRLRERFLAESAGNYYSGILAESLSSVAETEAQQAQVFSRYQQILVHQCATEGLAEPFSVNCGSYKRREVRQTYGRHREPFHIFSTVSTGEETGWVDERNVRVEELTQLGRGALLCGKFYPVPILISHLRNGGNHHAVHMRELPPGGE